MPALNQLDHRKHLRRLGEGAVVSYAFECSRLPLEVALDPNRLSQTELNRYERFNRESSRFAFLAGRCLLRTFLEFSIPDTDISIELASGGKPFFSHPQAPCFNLSHSANWLFLAFCRDQAPGVDVEESSRVNNVNALADRFFSASEREQVHQGGREEFFRLWTRKEARLKASGEGLRVRLSDLDTLAEEAEGLWHFETVYPSDGVVACVCYAGESRTHYFTRC
jgi:4'-phosphopantetheinyl transferase